jgi:hypothetical protein
VIPETLASALTSASTSAVIVAPGARAAQARLFGELGAVLERRDAALHAALAADDAPAVRSLLARPLRVVVPSSSLRDHVSEALLRHFGRSLAAVVVSTQWALALAVLERRGEAPVGGEELFRLLVRRFAAEEPLLSATLGALHEGYGIVEATARDLVDAGIEAHLAEPLDDLLAEQASADAERMRAVVRATLRAIAALEREGHAPRAALLQRAAEVVRIHGDAALPTAAMWVYGFADATGVVADWIEELLRRFDARVVIDVPPDPFEVGAFESEFSQPFVERMEHAASECESLSAEVTEPSSLALVRAPGAVAEVRAVALRIRALLDDGVAPESIGVVARGLNPYRASLEANFTGLAIPFSAPGAAGSPDAQTRRLAAAARLFAEVELAPVDAWLAASAHPEAGDGDLRVGLHVLGAARLVDLANLDLATIFAKRDFVPLPIRRGSSEEAESNGDAPQKRGSPSRVRSRGLHRDRLERAHAKAQALVGRITSWPESAPFAEHHGTLMRLIGDDLGWQTGDGALAPALASLDALRDDVPDGFGLTRAEFALLVARALERASGSAFGGKGAGVQVLSVMSARGRTFGALFVLGLQRDAFPRTPSEDPIVSDALRRAMRAVLPELPVKAQGHAEERHLFAELLSASPRVTLSWQHVSDEGREVLHSSFITRLCLEHPGLAIETAPAALGAREHDDTLRPAHEHAIRAALYGARAALAPVRSEALREVRELLGGSEDGVDVAALARVQLAILDEIDPDRRTRAGRERSAQLGPYFGFVGARAALADATHPELFVTRLEDVARCPWQSFLRRELYLEPVPDALDALPALAPSVIGNVVHAVLQRIVDNAVGVSSSERVSLRAALERGAVRVAWPAPAVLQAIAEVEAVRVAEDDGVRIAGFARALARRALSMVEVARARDWADPAGLPALGAELGGDLVVHDAAGRERRIGFRVDRADLAGGVLCLTDYKTGPPLKAVVREETKREKLLQAAQQGRALQAVAYLAAARTLGMDQAEGRLLYLREDIDERTRAFVAQHGDTELAAAFEATARTLFAALDAGTVFPRLVLADQDKEPAACGWCEVAVACLRGESSQRARLRNWADDTTARHDDASASARALFAAFALGSDLEVAAEVET